MNKLEGKEKIIWYITFNLSILLLILGIYLKVKEVKSYEGITTATCHIRTRCTYNVNSVDYIYKADYYTDVNPNKPIERKIRYNINDPSENHLTEMGISESCVFLAISLIILNFMYFIMKEKVLFLGAGLFALFISFLLYSPLLGTMNPLLYFKTFKYYGLNTLVPLLFFLGGLIFIFLSFKRFIWKEKEKTVVYQKTHKYVKETKEERALRKEKEEKRDKNINTIFDFAFIFINFIEAGITGYTFFYLMCNLFNEDKEFIRTPVVIPLIGIFIFPLFLIFVIKVIDIIALYFIKKDIQEKINIFDKIKDFLKIILITEVLCSILFLFISSIIHENLITILFISIVFIFPIALMIIYYIYHFILENSNITNKEILSINFDKIAKIIGIILISLFLLFGIVAVIAGMVYAIKEKNYIILFFYLIWLITLSAILYYVLKQSKKI